MHVVSSKGTPSPATEEIDFESHVSDPDQSPDHSKPDADSDAPPPFPPIPASHIYHHFYARELGYLARGYTHLTSPM